MIEEKFKKTDYIISPSSGDMAIYDKIDKKGYIHFKEYYGNMFHAFKDVSKYTLQINYQKFWRLCNEEEKQHMNELLQNKNTDSYFN